MSKDEVFDEKNKDQFPKDKPEVDPPMFKDEADLESKLKSYAVRARGRTWSE